MRNYDKNYEYVEVREAPRLTISESDRFMAERAVRLSSAKRAYLRIMESFSITSGKARSARQAVKLRKENQRRHDLAGDMGHWPMSRTS